MVGDAEIDECCGVEMYVFFFFFSSRRRHTRLVSDWSSDVCSSDLPDLLAGALPQGDPGSKKLMALPVSIKSGGAAATRDRKSVV